MKIRGDFVTNSSSVSFILTAKEEIIELNIAQYKGSHLGDFYARIYEKLKNEGEKISFGKDELYSLKMDFLTDDWKYPIPDCETTSEFYDWIQSKDIKSMSDEELTCILEFALLNPSFIPNLGATRIKTY